MYKIAVSACSLSSAVIDPFFRSSLLTFFIDFNKNKNKIK
jgi:hypothetical protein